MRKLLGKKYSTMIRLRTSLLSTLLLAFVSFSSNLQANELKDISQLLAQGQSAQALDKVNAYLDAKPRDVSGQFLKGVILAEQNKSADAIRIFSSITEKHPELPEPYNNLAVLYAEQGRYDKARQALEKAIRTHPSYATAHENLGDIYAKMASEAYDKALQLDRGNARAQTKLSMVKELFVSSSIALPPAKAEESVKITATPVVGIPKPEPVAATPVESVKSIEIKEAPPAKEKAEFKADDQQEVKEAVEKWAKAWSDRDVRDYLAAYADDFKTPRGESRSEWEKMRKERIRKPSSIQVDVLNLKVEVDGNRATAAFKQSYRAGGNTMRTSKTLHLRKASGRWLITQELAKS